MAPSTNAAFCMLTKYSLVEGVHVSEEVTRSLHSLPLSNFQINNVHYNMLCVSIRR